MTSWKWQSIQIGDEWTWLGLMDASTITESNAANLVEGWSLTIEVVHQLHDGLFPLEAHQDINGRASQRLFNQESGLRTTDDDLRCR